LEEPSLGSRRNQILLLLADMYQVRSWDEVRKRGAPLADSTALPAGQCQRQRAAHRQG